MSFNETHPIGVNRIFERIQNCIPEKTRSGLGVIKDQILRDPYSYKSLRNFFLLIQYFNSLNVEENSDGALKVVQFNAKQITGPIPPDLTIVNFEQMILPFLPPGNRFQDRYKFFPRVNDQQTQGRTIWIAQHHFIHIDHNFKQDITITPSTRDNTANVSIHIIHGQNDLGTTRGFFESSDLIPSGFFPPTLLPSDEWYFIQSFVDNPLPQAQVA